MPFVSARGLSLHVQEQGSGPPLVMLHGLLLGNLAYWHLMYAPALARSRRVLLYDLRGHGQSERPAKGYDVASHAGDLEALHEALAPGELVDLVGHSYGALVALRYAIDRPGRVRRVVLIDTPLPPSSLPQEYRRLFDSDPQALLELLPPGLAGRLFSGIRRQRRTFEQMRALLDGTTLSADIDREPDLSDAELASLSRPALAVAGTGSPCLPAARRIAGTAPAARLLEMDGGHFLPLERPEELAAAIASFLDEADA